MALAKLLNSRSETPYFRPPPLRIFIIRLQEQEKAVAWEFREGMAKPINIKKNKLAVVTDGETVTKITLFEEFSSKVQEGVTYVMRGHGLRGTAPPYQLNITAQTQFFRGSSMDVPQELFLKAEDLLCPPAPHTPLYNCSTKGGLMTVEGEVVEFSAIKRVLSGKVHVPLRNLQIKEDNCTRMVCLWREAAIQPFDVGDHLKISHVKLNESAYGPQLHMTSFTKLETKQEDMAEVHIIGVDTTERPNQLEVLMEDGSSLYISSDLWKPYEEELEKDMVAVTIKRKGKEITEIMKSQLQSQIN